jgi:hypothetical protein
MAQSSRISEMNMEATKLYDILELGKMELEELRGIAAHYEIDADFLRKAGKQMMIRKILDKQYETIDR